MQQPCALMNVNRKGHEEKFVEQKNAQDCD
jgi:hypothetical protein